MITKTEPTITIQIYLAGPIDRAKEICAEYAFSVGLCITVTPTEFIYTGGRETGFVVGLVNYPRFPTTLDALVATAEDLAVRLMAGCFQWSALVVGPAETKWLTRREEAPAPTSQERTER